MNRTILITGISGGVGKALTEYFIEQGDTVVGLSQSMQSRHCKNLEVFNVKISEELEIRTLFQNLRKSGKIPDVVINNSAVSFDMLSLVTSKQQFQKSFEVNLLGAFLVTREAVKLMKKKGWGRVLFMSSINTVLNSSGAISYNATKGGLEGLMATFAKEIVEHDITFNALGLSLVRGTPMAGKLSPTAKEEKTLALLKDGFLSIEELIHGVEFFLDINARNITNQTLYYGGITK